MSAFDYVHVEYELDAPVTAVEWQSKSVDEQPYGNHFKIDADGQLWRLEIEILSEPRPDMKVPKDTIIVPFRERREEWAPIRDYSGVFTFYDKIPHRDTVLWWEYEAAFEDGKMTYIKRIKPRVIPE